MKTILAILQKAGGWRPNLYLKIDNPPYVELVIEAMDESGPCGLMPSLIAGSRVNMLRSITSVSEQGTVSAEAFPRLFGVSS